jgi:hypothetical protein
LEKLPPKGDGEISLFQDENWKELNVIGDTLKAFITSKMAVLNQKEKLSFTDKDMKLREIVLKLYPHERPTPFPWSYTQEPEFERS